MIETFSMWLKTIVTKTNIVLNNKHYTFETSFSMVRNKKLTPISCITWYCTNVCTKVLMLLLLYLIIWDNTITYPIRQGKEIITWKLKMRR